ncbi:MAG: phosphoglycerate kinase [Gammaproteobacteria bacterium]
MGIRQPDAGCRRRDGRVVLRTAADIDWRGKIAVWRADFNTPLAAGGEIADDLRIRASLPTARHILREGGGIVCLSHLGRPREGVFDSALSLRPAAARLSELLKTPVQFQPRIPKTKPRAGEVWMSENVRFNRGEKECAPALAAEYAATGDVFVMDAFATAHRRECSTCALAAATGDGCAGLLLAREIAALSRAMDDPARPFLAIVGGAKVSTKLPALRKLLAMCDRLIAGGGVANTFMAADGMPVGASLTEEKMYAEARELLKMYRDKIILPPDVVVAAELSDSARARTIKTSDLSEIGDAERILDVGERTQSLYAENIARARTVVWSGPAGAFEYAPFAAGTRAVARAVGESAAYSLAGGGDTLAAAARFCPAGISYLSTGGGAFLEFLGGATLPALHSLRESLRKRRRGAVV